MRLTLTVLELLKIAEPELARRYPEMRGMFEVSVDIRDPKNTTVELTSAPPPTDTKPTE